MKKKKTWLFILSLILLLSLCPAAYGGEDGNDPVDKTLAPYFLVEGADPSSDSFPLKDRKAVSYTNLTLPTSEPVVLYLALLHI